MLGSQTTRRGAAPQSARVEGPNGWIHLRKPSRGCSPEEQPFSDTPKTDHDMSLGGRAFCPLHPFLD